MKPVFILDLTPAVVFILTAGVYILYAGFQFIRAVIRRGRHDS